MFTTKSLNQSKINKLFQNADAVLQKAGFNKTPDERSSEEFKGCYVNSMKCDIFEQHEEAMKSLVSFVDQLDISDIDKARSELLEKFWITNDGREIFNIPKQA